MILRDKQGRFLKKKKVVIDTKVKKCVNNSNPNLKSCVKTKLKKFPVNLYDLHEMITAEVAFQLRGIQKSKPKSWWSLK